MLFTSVQFTNVHILDSMYTYVSYDGQCIVMRGLIAQAEDSLQENNCSCVWLFWSDQKATDGRESGLGVWGPKWFY